MPLREARPVLPRHRAAFLVSEGKLHRCSPPIRQNWHKSGAVLHGAPRPYERGAAGSAHQGHPRPIQRTEERCPLDRPGGPDLDPPEWPEDGSVALRMGSEGEERPSRSQTPIVEPPGMP